MLLTVFLLTIPALLGQPAAPPPTETQPSTETQPPALGSQLLGVQSETEEEGFAEQIVAEVGKAPLFGTDIFQVDVSQLTPGPVDPEVYLVAPGDRLLLQVWGQVSLERELRVTPDLFVNMEEGGRVYLGGMTLSRARAAITRQLATAYASFIDPDDPESSTARVELTPVEVRDVQFLVHGEVEQPGSYTLHTSLSNLVYALARAGGVRDTASLRNIRIRRGGAVRTVDFYRFLLGDTLDPGQLQIQTGDVIHVPLNRREVAIRGEVRRPMRYELLPQEHLGDLLSMAGGLKPTASLDKGLILRTVLNEGLRTVDVDIGEVTGNGLKVPLEDLDIVTVYPSYLQRIDFVAAEGQGIALPGEYQLRADMTLRDLIELAGGLTGLAYQRRADLVRTRPDMTRVYQSVDLEQVMARNPAHDLRLESMDRLIVYTVAEIEGAERYVRLRGHVKFPGRFELYRGMRLYDLLFAKGGFQDRDYLRRTYTARADLLRVSEDGAGRELIGFDLQKLLAGDAAENHLLQADDEIIVYSVEEVASVEHQVEVAGHVKRPGQYRLWRGMTLAELVEISGGFQDPGFRNEAFLDRADLVRRESDGRQMTRRLIRFNLGRLLDGDPSHNHVLAPGDRVVIYAAEDFTVPQTVAVDGLVKKPGTYPYAANLTLGDLLVQAGGLLEGAYARVEIFRLSAVGGPGVERQVTQVDIGGDFLGTTAASVELRNNDHVFVRRHPDFEREVIVELQGEVRFPGRYVLRSEQERISDLLNRAGGLKDSAHAAAASLQRLGGSTFAPPAGDATARPDRQRQRIVFSLEEALKNPGSDRDLLLKSGDLLTVPKFENVVVVRGAVLKESTLTWQSGKGPDYYIRQAGGYSEVADRKGATITYPDGRTVRITGGFLGLGGVNVEPMSVIEVPAQKYTF